MNPFLEFRNINVLNGNHLRLKNINLSICEGEKVALIGRSGSGKSTLFNVANGTIPKIEGEVLWKQQAISKLTQRKRVEIATLWQDLRLIDELNVSQNINAGALGRQNIFWAIANLLGICNSNKCEDCIKASYFPLELINTSIKKLSGGQKQRVALARLLIQEADLMLLDEPFSNLDPILIYKVLKILISKNSFKSISIPSTCIISLHRPDLLKYFTRVIGLKEGQIIIDKKPQDIKSEEIEIIYKSR